MNHEPLGKHADLIRGVTFTPTDKCEVGAADSVVCMRTKNVQVALDESDLIAIPRSLVVGAKKMLRRGDILVSSANSWNLVGKCCPVPELGYPATAGGFISILRPTSETLDASYLYRWFSSENVQATVRSLGNQTTNISNLSHRRTMELGVPLPPLAEQKRIAGILDAADALRAKRREALAQLDTLLQSTFLHMFGDPVTNPMGWEVRNFDDVCESRLGKMLDAKKQVGDNPRPYMRNINVQWGELDLSSVWKMDFNAKERAELRLLPNDVLICEGGAGVAQTAVWRGEIEECYFQKSLHRVRPKACSANSDYIAYLIRMLMREGSELFRLVSSATIPHLTGVKLKTLKTQVPPLDLQLRFAAIVASVEQQKTRMRAHLSELDALFASLQSRAFNGEL